MIRIIVYSHDMTICNIPLTASNITAFTMGLRNRQESTLMTTKPCVEILASFPGNVHTHENTALVFRTSA